MKHFLITLLFATIATYGFGQDAIYYRDYATYLVFNAGTSGDMGCPGYQYDYYYTQINVPGPSVSAFQNAGGQSYTAYGTDVYLKTTNTGTYNASSYRYTYTKDAFCNQIDNGTEPYQANFSFKVEDFTFSGWPDFCQPQSVDINNYLNGASVPQRYYIDNIQVGNAFSSSNVGAGGHTIRIERDYAQGTISKSANFTVYAQPVVFTHPSNASGCPSGAASFSASVGGSNIALQWEESYNGGGSWNQLTNAGEYSGVTSSTLNISNITGKTSYIYRVRVTGTCAVIYSNNATLSVYGQVAVGTSPPADIWKCRGEALNVTVSGTPRNGSMNYMWQYKYPAGAWTDWGITTATNSSATATDGSWDGLQVRVRLRDNCGSVTENYTSVGTIHIYAVATTSNPSSPTVCSGGNPTFTVTAGGEGPFTYQWYEDGVALNNNAVYSGATSATLTVNGATIAFSGKKYKAKVTGKCNDATSADATLTVANPPSVTSDPSAVTTCAGTSASFTVGASGSSLQYQWAYSTTGGVSTFSDIGGATSATYTIGSVAGANAGYYRVKVFNSICSSPVNSNSAQLVVNPVTSAGTPGNQAVCPNGNATFTVSASGSGTLTYQWQRALAATPTSFSNLSGQTFSSLTVSNAQLTDSGNKYRVIVHSNCGSDVTTAAATLTVNPIPSAPTAPSVARCGDGSLSATASSAASSPVFNWYAQTDDVTPVFTGATYTIANLTSTITYYVSVTSSCESPKTAVTFTRNATQNVAMGGPLSLCVAQGAYNLENDIVDATAKGNNFTWTANSTSYNSKTFNPNVGAGTYIVTYVPPTGVQSSPKCYLTTTRTITVVSGGGDGGMTFTSTEVAINTGNTINSCVGNAPVSLSNIPSAPGGEWSTVSGSGLSFNGTTAVFTPDQNSYTNVNPNVFRYSLSLNGCSVSKDLNIYVKDNTNKPIISGLPSVVCPETTISLAASVSNPGTFTYSWNKAGISTEMSSANPLSYKVIGTETLEVRSVNTFGCKSSATTVNISTPFAAGNIVASKSVLETGDKVKFTYDVNTAGNSYDWNFGDGSSGSVEKDPTHYFYTPGAFTIKLVVSSTLGCTQTLEYKTITVNGVPIDVVTGDIPVIESESSRAYPNPATDNVFIEASENIRSVALHDLSGRLQYSAPVSGKKAAINLMDYPTGMYVVTLQFEKTTKQIKVIKK